MEQKYFNFLNDIYQTYGTRQFKNMSQIMNRHKIGNYSIALLYDGGILTKTGSSTGTVYRWATIPPNMHMVNELLTRIKRYNLEKNKSYKQQQQTSQISLPLKQKRTRRKKVVEPIKETKKISLFWGLLKIEY